MRADLVVRGAHVVLAAEVRRADVVVDNGTIAAVIAPDDTTYQADDEIDARGKHVLPGLVDGHVHFNDPGHAEREGYFTGTRAAAAGGVTTVIDMPLSCTPTTISLGALEAKRAVAASAAIVDYGHWGGLVTDNVAAMAALHEAGVLGFKAFMAETGIDDFPRATDGVLLAGLREAARLDTVVLVHAENEEIATYLTARLLDQGRRDPLAWAEGRPEVVEVEGIRCALFLAGVAGARVHIVHVSTPAGLDAVHAARAAGCRVTAETCPQYLTLCDEDLARIGVGAEMWATATPTGCHGGIMGARPRRRRRLHRLRPLAVGDGGQDAVRRRHLGGLGRHPWSTDDGAAAAERGRPPAWPAPPAAGPPHRHQSRPPVWALSW